MEMAFRVKQIKINLNSYVGPNMHLVFTPSNGIWPLSTWELENAFAIVQHLVSSAGEAAHSDHYFDGFHDDQNFWHYFSSRMDSQWPLEAW